MVVTQQSTVSIILFLIYAGDFVILLISGLSLKRALCWNFIASLSAFVGLYIGIVIGENEVADQWIFAVTSGMFLYVALADMVSDVVKNVAFP